MAAAVESSYYSSSAFDQEVVPTLRKRLESEARMLENRLSGPSSPARYSGVDLPPTAVNSSTSRQKRAPSPGYPSASSSNSQLQESTIPRPSISASQELYHHYNGSGSRPPQVVNDQIRPYTSMNASNSQLGFKRTRTNSTPYSFDREEVMSKQRGGQTGGRKSPMNTSGLTGMPTPASSRANSPLAGSASMLGPGQSGSYGASAGSANNSRILNDRPSKIPMRKRQRSNSNAPPSSTGRQTASSDLGPGDSRHGKGSTGDSVHQAIMFPPSPETSPELWLERQDPSTAIDSLSPNSLGVPKIKDETAPFNPKRMSRASFEEREFEHWYRGEGREGGGRNGGVGEIKVAKADTTREMLDIAVGGHQIPGRDRWASRKRTAGMHPEDSLARTRHPDPNMEYVMDEAALTDMDGDATDYYVAEPEQQQTYDEFGNTYAYGGEDLDDYYYGGTDEPAQPGRSSTSLPPAAIYTTTAIGAGGVGLTPDAVPRGPSRASQVSHVQEVASEVPLPPKTPQPDKARRPSTTAATTATPRKGSANGGPAASKIPDARARTQSRVRQRAVSRGDERPPPMADAIPPWAQSPPPPTNGNWDDVVLPTVAKKMGLNNKSEVDITMLGDGKREGPGRTFEPAPGTFAYDRSKIRSPSASSVMGDLELGGKQSADIGRRSEQSSPPPRSPSPQPFAAYMPVAAEEYVPQPRVSQEVIPPPRPIREASPPRQEPPRAQTQETKAKPTIFVTSPSELGVPARTAKMEDDEGAGCCKCVIM
ncbi:hypothetical protein FRB96_001746 [Tulasnella sp. 330]|nr:hypothetical protein FRB96_001746 [Tulasnella sp. 330]KAG8885838.1 hypothetical protein FRB98_001584 [Tulasnella sp. 332]